LNIKEEAIKKMNHISIIINKKWAKKMLELYHLKEKEVVTYTDFKKKLKANDKLVGEYINKLVDAGIIKKLEKGKGYVRTKIALNYDLKYEDMRFLQDCPFTHMVSHTVVPQENSSPLRTATYYGLEKIDPTLEDMIIPTLIDIRKYIDSIHEKKLWEIIKEEFKNIENKKIIEAIKNWYDELKKEIILYPERRRGKVNSLNFKGEPPEGYAEEYYNVINKVWWKFSDKCPPIAIVFRF